jgi:hypothetical protein
MPATVGACSPLAARFDRTIAIITIPAVNIINWGMIRQIFFIVAIPWQSRRQPRAQYSDFDRLNSTSPQNSGHSGSMSTQSPAAFDEALSLECSHQVPCSAALGHHGNAILTLVVGKRDRGATFPGDRANNGVS